MNTVFVGLQSMAAELGSTSCTALNEKVAAVASVKGHVRCENQDYCLGFEIGNITVELIADGCGATPHGTFASYAAVKEAARFIVRNLTHDNHQDIVPLARQALFHASGMMVEYAASAKPPVVDGFRTTLIVILADSKRYAFAYAGDGGGVVVRKNGNFEKFLFPQKADAEIMNVLATSLGPELDGEPASGAIPRYRGDTLIIGSDGIWDHVGPNFPLAATHSLAKAGGNVRLASEAIIQDLADFTDVKGHICTDNLTIGLMADSINADKPRKSNALAST
jgi:serine/threonine protein phosphatase PrpC